MINGLTIFINNGILTACYSYNDIPYSFVIDGFILPKGKDLYSYILSKIELCH